MTYLITIKTKDPDTIPELLQTAHRNIKYFPTGFDLEYLDGSYVKTEIIQDSPQNQ